MEISEVTEEFPDRLPYTTTSPLAHPAAANYVPRYLFKGVPDPSGIPDVQIRDDFMGTRRKLRIAVLGAGISCLNFLHFLFEHLSSTPEGTESVEVVVYERNQDVGGTWLLNRYPGCRCDIPSIVYQFSWKPRIWSEMYAPQPENLAYLQDTAREEGFYQYIKFQHEIMQASWTDETGRWILKVQDLETNRTFEDQVNIFCEFNGPVSKPMLQTITGIDDFKGTVVHPGHWPEEDYSLNLKDKKVALIGYGSSGVQIAPAIIDDVSKLYTWYRNPTYILPPPNQAWSARNGANFKYSDEQKELLKDPDIYLAYRKAVDETFYKRYVYTINGSQTADELEALVKKYMSTKLAKNPDLLSRILPKDFGLGCRRQAFAYGYMEAITSTKAHIFPHIPQRFTALGILDADNVEHPVDVVIAATGYDQSHMPRYPKLVNGYDLLETFKASPCPPSYMALMLKGMPNYFNPSSAYGPLPQGNFYQSSEVFAKYIIKCIDKMQLDRIVSIRPQDVAVEHWVRHANAYLKRTAVTGPCVAWYKGNDGVSRPPALWPGARLQFIKTLETPRFEDFDIVYEDQRDRFAFMGNGWTREWDAKVDEEGVDLMWYHGVLGKEVGRDVLERLRGVDGSVSVLTSGREAAPSI